MKLLSLSRSVALRLARGCDDYRGGHDGADLGLFHGAMTACEEAISALDADVTAEAILDAVRAVARAPGMPETYHHGAQTVLNVLTARATGTRDGQIAVAWAYGGR